MDAPYASTAIPVFLGSVTGMRYRIINCIECGQPLLERNNDSMFRLTDQDHPTEVKMSDWGFVPVLCGNCSQSYEVHISQGVQYDRDAIPLYLHPESLYMASEPTKRLRYVYCLECGHAFHSVADRISQVIDNRVPMEYVNPMRLGPLESTCSFKSCKQLWAFMV